MSKVIEWRGHKLRLDDEGTELTVGQAKVIKRATGLRVVAYQKALQEMVASEDLDPDLMSCFLWLLLDQNGQHLDIAELDDVTFAELSAALVSITADGVPILVDPTPAVAADSGPPPPTASNGSSTATSSGDATSTSSSSPITVGLVL